MIYIDTIKENRTHYIGGSDVPTILNLNKNKNYQILLSEYVKDHKSFEGNEYTEYGNLMESTIRNFFNKEYGFNATPNYIMFEDKKIRCNCDGLDRDSNIIIEIKTNNGKHTNTLDYEVQMQLYMWAFGVNEGYLIQYERPKNFYKGIIYEMHHSPEYFNLEFDPNNITVKKIKRSNPLIDHILKNINTFWEDVNKLKNKGDIL